MVFFKFVSTLITSARYCEAITSSITRGSPYLNPTLTDQLKELSSRLLGNPNLDKAGSWIGGRIAKPSLDSIGDWLGGRLSKFVAGEGESTPPPTEEEVSTSSSKHYAGTFSHYSAISSANTSTSPSPVPSLDNFNVLPELQPRRSGSAMALRPLSNPQVQIDRASSAMDHLRPSARSSSPVHRVASASATTTSFAQAPSFAQVLGGNEPPYSGTRAAQTDSNAEADSSQLRHAFSGTETEGTPVSQAASPWWASSNYDESNNKTPTATFFKIDAPTSPSGFTSLMDDYTPSPSSSHPPSDSPPTRLSTETDDDDLGLGNSSSKKKGGKDDGEPVEGHTSTPQKEESVPPKKPGANVHSHCQQEYL